MMPHAPVAPPATLFIETIDKKRLPSERMRRHVEEVASLEKACAFGGCSFLEQMRLARARVAQKNKVRRSREVRERARLCIFRLARGSICQTNKPFHFHFVNNGTADEKRRLWLSRSNFPASFILLNSHWSG